MSENIEIFMKIIKKFCDDRAIFLKNSNKIYNF